MAARPDQLRPEHHQFLTDRHYATLTTLHRDGRPHVVPVGFSWWPDEAMALVSVPAVSQKTLNAERDQRVSLCQSVDHRWLTLQGHATVHRDPAWIERAVNAYKQRYGRVGITIERACIEIHVDTVLLPLAGPFALNPT